MGWGGRRTGAGRKPGSVIKRTRAVIDGALAEGISPLDYMIAVMRDPNADQRRRDEMARSAAPFVHPRLSTVDASVDATASTQRIGSVNILAIESGCFLTEAQIANPSILLEFAKPTLIVDNREPPPAAAEEDGAA